MICVGVDAGGTSTAVAVSSDGALLGVELGPAANATTLGVEAAAAAIVATIRRALDGR
jgi:N-acetylglucosamine kinase-like BadF-type ATPase